MPYNPEDPFEIERYGRRLLGSSLRVTPGVRAIPDQFLEQASGGRTRGKFGEVLERYYYGIQPGNAAYVPDFPEAEVELKSTGMVRKPRGYPWGPKERLVLNMYNYLEEPLAECIEASSFYKKNASIMLVGYEWESGKPLVDLCVRCAGLLQLPDIPQVDWEVVVSDFHFLQRKVRSGKAHEISEADTNYLALCRKGNKGERGQSGVYGSEKLYGRAYSFKAGFVHSLLGGLEPGWNARAQIGPRALEHIETSLEDDFLARFHAFRHWTLEQISVALQYKVSTAKSANYLLAIRIAGGAGRTPPAELQKAQVLIKTVHLQENGYLKESMSFEAFDFSALVNEDWNAPAILDEDDEENPAYPQFRRLLEHKVLMVVFQGERGPNSKLVGAFFWQMDFETLNGEVKRVWSRMREAVGESNPSAFPKISESPVAHVRPKALNESDRDTLPNGKTHIKQCFWLNASFVAAQIRERLGINAWHG